MLTFGSHDAKMMLQKMLKPQNGWKPPMSYSSFQPVPQVGVGPSHQQVGGRTSLCCPPAGSRPSSADTGIHPSCSFPSYYILSLSYLSPDEFKSTIFQRLPLHVLLHPSGLHVQQNKCGRLYFQVVVSLLSVVVPRDSSDKNQHVRWDQTRPDQTFSH